ncbi:sugar ABC transporter substrate-binding protein [Microbacterium sp. zg.Y625]|uniref:sugar ABC transporter substrate-binding protein n=1 Tax=Microbacterium jiangjiandongii TaxID=3049071 RepID=UPI00214BFD01|nr:MULTISPECIES: sugar ABC transporter substrate-binding protein [unclassified Microbacterium]MCR2793440.1 sugar ABC transporter substrate-binding protein [Microbacterium sp. zg.Y625]MCR2815382.1 sugar ABC transporter substrate-binding protein [Microbacterium sp. zg.Y843]WIM25189.1 sugar ABC transporter substrate-binding protein [Microbacterium sp. zg-Y625]
MRKHILPIAVLGVAALGLTACGGGGNTGSDDAGGEGKTLDVWIMQGTNPDAEPFFDEVAEAFEEETGATLNVEFVQWADAHDRFVTSIAGGTTPDVAETGTTWTAEFADAGALAPIGDMVAEAGIDDDLVAGLVESGTYADELYGMPWYAGVRSLVYRTDVFEELGLDAPSDWEELRAAGLAIKEGFPDMTAVAVPGDAEQTVYPWVWGAGGTVATQDGDEWVSGLDSAESIAGLEFWTGLATEHGLSSAGATTWKETDVLDQFAAGTVGMAVMGSWTPTAIVDKNPEMDGKFAAIPIPAEDGGIAPSVLGGSHLSMFETADDKDLAFAFIKMMTTGEFAEKWGQQSGYFPGQTSLLEETIATADPMQQPFATQMVEGGGSLPVTPTFGAVQAKKTTGAMVQAILSGQKDVATAAKDAAAEMTAVLNGQ